MHGFSISFSQALGDEAAAQELADGAEQELGGCVAGGCLLATAAAGGQGRRVGALLGERWPQAGLVGTSFEGLVAESRVWRDQPALGLLAWSPSEREPIPLAFSPDVISADRMVSEIVEACGGEPLGPGTLLLLFPDAHCSAPIEELMAALVFDGAGPSIAGAAASGVDGDAALAWVEDSEEPRHEGGMVGLLVPASNASEAGARVSTASASRSASPWLEVTAFRSRWVDRLDGAPALTEVRRHLGLGPRDDLEPHLSKLLVRHRVSKGGVEGPYREAYMIGLDDRGGAFSIPAEVERGDQIALAWPDAMLARENLERGLEDLVGSSGLLQFACRARDAALHGDDDLESAWVAAHAGDRRVLGTVAPFQIGPDPTGRSRLHVHATVLAALP